MPKEITHWLIAHQTTIALRGSPLGELAAAHPNCVRLGAVVHDAAFYARDRRWKQALLTFAGQIHSRGRGTFDIIDSVLRAAKRTPHAAQVRALIIGMLSHIAADSCFHPLVYHETGNYYDPDPDARTRAVRRHRRFETMLDVYLAGTPATIHNFSLHRCAHSCELPVATLLEEAFEPVAADFAFPQLSPALLHSLHVFKRMQAMYSTMYMTRSLDVLYPLLSNSAKEIAALFYLPRFIKHLARLQSPRSFPDPETGHTITTTVRDVYSSAIELSVALCRRSEGALLGHAPFNPPQLRMAPDLDRLCAPADNRGA